MLMGRSCQCVKSPINCTLKAPGAVMVKVCFGLMPLLLELIFFAIIFSFPRAAVTTLQPKRNNG